MLLNACGGYYLGLPKASPGNYGIVGFVGKGSQQAAPSELVTLADADGKQLGSVTTDAWGKFKFYPLPAGSYTLTCGDKQLPVIITDNHQRVDIDLNAKDGKMDYVAGSMKNAQGGKVAAQGPNDPELQKQFAGYYWGFSAVGAGSTGGGGTERKKNFCADGRFYDMSESSYYGREHNQYGDETMNWSATGSNSSVAQWTISGTLQQGTITITYPNGNTSQIQYQAGNDPRDYTFDNYKVSKTQVENDPCR